MLSSPRTFLSHPTSLHPTINSTETPAQHHKSQSSSSTLSDMKPVVSTSPPSPSPTAPSPSPLTFPKSLLPFSQTLFQSPSAEYRGCPLWAWNTTLSQPALLRQIDVFQSMGFGGFHMHVRTGLDTDYLGTKFMDTVRECVLYAEKKGMMACLYDEDRWPSGTAGGKVVEQEVGFRGKHLLWTRVPYGEGDVGRGAPSSGEGVRSENGWLLGRYEVELGDEGQLGWYKLLEEGEEVDEELIWYAYVEANTPSPWFNGQTYVDTLNPKAMAAFIESTHETYKSAVGDKFGTAVPCIFTDEPQFARKTRLANAHEKKDVFLPWTDDLPQTYADAYGGSDLLALLPELIFNLADSEPSLLRYRYHDHVCTRFVTAFMDQISTWCDSNNILLNGHMMEEPTLASQSSSLGEAMRCYRSMGLPGMDLLNDSVEFNTAKQVVSVARQRGLKGAMSEIYGCTHWNFTFEGHKGCGDWQAALGITFRVPHLAWASMAGEGKRDYPASLGYQSPWHEEYGMVEDHFARIGTAMTRGKAVVRAAVIHPIESYWCLFGPDEDGNGDELRLREARFAELTEWLLRGLVDFDFISESMLPDMCGGIEGEELTVGEVRGKRWQRRGITLVDGHYASTHSPWLQPSKHVPWEKDAVLGVGPGVLEKYKDLDILDANSRRPETLLYQLRGDGDEQFLFVCNTDRKNGFRVTVDLKGVWDVELLDTLSGKQTRLESLLARLLPRSAPDVSPLLSLQHRWTATKKQSRLQGTWLKLQDVELSEPNVLMLDYASYSVAMYPPRDAALLKSGLQEILAINKEVLDIFHLPRKGQAWRQPWTLSQSDREDKGQVKLCFPFLSEADIEEPTQLAIELPERVSIVFNDTRIYERKPYFGSKPDTWWVDEAISTLTIPPNTITKGLNKLTIHVAFGVLTNIERVYILGTFKVRLPPPNSLRANPTLIPWRPTTDPLSWGDITSQNLPFDVGNLTYKCKFDLPFKSTAKISVPQFESPVLAIRFNGEKLGRIAFRPRKLELGVLEKGEHAIEIVCHGNRYNAFGHVHASDWMTTCWPDAWRTQGWAWEDGYRVKPVGVWKGVVLFRRVEEDGEVQNGPGDVQEDAGNDEDNGSRSENDWVLVSPPGTP